MGEGSIWRHYPGSIAHSDKLALPRQPSIVARAGERVHFVFVEGVEEIENPAALEAPDSTTIAGEHEVFKDQPVRFRTSGPEATAFLNSMNRFEESNSEDPDDAWRERRLKQLTAFFGMTPVPIIDIYVARPDKDYRAVRQTLIPGSWHIAVFNTSGAAKGEKLVLFGGPEFRPEERVRWGILRTLSPVAPPIELKLRDVFSLNHVKDSDLGPETDDGGPSGPPPTPKGILEGLRGARRDRHLGEDGLKARERQTHAASLRQKLTR